MIGCQHSDGICNSRFAQRHIHIVEVLYGSQSRLETDLSAMKLYKRHSFSSRGLSHNNQLDLRTWSCSSDAAVR